MDIILTNAGGQPIYDQIVSQVKAQILSGKLKEGDALPSLRALAKDLRISVITTKRAYEELEREGFIVSLTGKGSFVAGANTELIREEHLRRLEDHLREAVSLSHLCGLDLDGLTSILSMLYKEEDL
ncbi:MAG: GntR family transcriptional regulator [Christensenellales bacterium]|jgi:GntR family transcriptional regulator|nr:GntR family transcriptional regulator [Clostridiales bacterium]MEE1439675.1 GntR family transcriptional regulator [Christensenellales bacterium]